MFKRIKKYFDDRLIQQAAERTIERLTTTLAPQAPHPSETEFRVFNSITDENTLTLSGPDGEPIFSISSRGEAKWYKESGYGEAADIFLTYLVVNIEDKAGIMQNRIEWEERITEAIAKEAEAAPLGPEELTDVIRKCIMYDKLKGIKN